MLPPQLDKAAGYLDMARKHFASLPWVRCSIKVSSICDTCMFVSGKVSVMCECSVCMRYVTDRVLRRRSVRWNSACTFYTSWASTLCAISVLPPFISLTSSPSLLVPRCGLSRREPRTRYRTGEPLCTQRCARRGSIHGGVALLYVERRGRRASVCFRSFAVASEGAVGGTEYGGYALCTFILHK